MSDTGSAAVVDAAAGCVRAGDRSWPFELDLRAGLAALELDAGRARLRPLQWGEKVRLARFARVEGGVLEEQFLRLSSLDGVDAELDPAQRDALAALALWLNAPDAGSGEAGLPLEASVLALVTLEVCRAMDLTPGDLDGREAPEVEALWRAAATAEAPGASAPGAFGSQPVTSGPATTRILVIPDEPDAPATGIRDGTSGEAHVAQAAPMVQAAPSADAPRAAQRPRGPDGQRGAPVEPTRSAARRRLVDRFRPVALGELTAVSQPARAGAAPAPTPSARVETPQPPGAARRANGGPASTGSIHATPGSGEPWTAARPGPAEEVSAPPYWPPGGGLDTRDAQIPAAVRLDPDEREALLDELGRRLELAAAELGIDTER